MIKFVIKIFIFSDDVYPIKQVKTIISRNKTKTDYCSPDLSDEREAHMNLVLYEICFLWSIHTLVCSSPIYYLFF